MQKKEKKAFKVPQISQILTDFLPLKVTQIAQMTQIFYL